MALATLTVYSRALNMDTTINVLLPEKRLSWPQPVGDKKYPVLYLLHGHCQDHNSWLKSSRIDWYLRKSEVITVFPNGDRAFYVDGVYTHQYQKFLTQELPIILSNYFPVSTKREDTYIGGMSMGGYGALNIGLNHPDQYGHVITMAPAIVMFQKMDQADVSSKGGPPVDDLDNELNMQAIFGSPERFTGSEYDVYACLDRLAASDGPKPEIFLSCGTEDFLYDTACRLAEKIKTVPDVDFTFFTNPGIHDWDNWDYEIVEALRHFKLIGDEIVRK